MQAYTKEHLLGFKKAAADQIAKVRTGGISVGSLKKHLHQYILSKFLLTEEDCQTEDLDELTRTSLAKSLKIDEKLVEEYDQAAGCTGATSATTKKTLLFMAIQRDLNIALSPRDLAEINNVSQLSELVWTAMESGRKD